MNLEKVTREDNMTLRSLLASSNYEVKTIGPKIRVETACALLDRNRIGALPVVDGDGAFWASSPSATWCASSRRAAPLGC